MPNQNQPPKSSRRKPLTRSNVPRLRFTDEEIAEPALQKPLKKAQKAEKKLNKAGKKVPGTPIQIKERVIHPKTSKTVTRLRFEKIPDKKPPGMVRGMAQDALRAAPMQLLRQAGRGQEDGDVGDIDVGIVGVEAIERVENYAETVFRTGESSVRHAEKLRPFKRLEKAEKRLDRANVRLLQEKSVLDNPRGTVKNSGAPGSSHPKSRQQQRRAVKRQYAKMKRQHIRQTGGGRIRRAVDRTVGGIAENFRKSKRFLSIAALGFLLVALVMNGLSSCSPIIQSTFQAIAVSTYPADEADMKAAERAYAAMEQEMRDYLRWYEWTHDYDEYEYDLDELWHDPHVLMAILSAWNDGEAWVMDDKLYDQLALIFDQQYKLIEEVERATRYRTVDGELEPYYYYTCKVTLINENLSHRPVYFMSKEQLGMYAMYMVTLGNYPDLFRGNRYASTIKEPGEYDIPEEALQDPKFARLIEEAEKYIGYPYVWGGKDPSTSFDCSGFVSYVYTHSGVLNIGFLGVTSLYNMCTPISLEQARPGDMVFFEGTINRHDGLSHVGIYVGNGMFLHCGNPIGYADLNSSYYQEHYFGVARPPI